MLVWYKLPVDDLKKIEYAKSLNGFYVEVCILRAVHIWFVFDDASSM